MEEKELELFSRVVEHSVLNLKDFKPVSYKHPSGNGYEIDNDTYFIHLSYRSKDVEHELVERFYANFKSENNFNLIDLKNIMLKELILLEKFSHYEINIVNIFTVKDDIGICLNTCVTYNLVTYSVPVKLVFEYEGFYEIPIIALLWFKTIEVDIKNSDTINSIKNRLKEVNDKIKLKDFTVLNYK